MPVRVRLLSVPICVLACASAQAQWRGSAGISVGETYSDNINRGGAGQQRDDFATDVAPWFNYAGRGARSSGSIDAKLHNWFHTDQQSAGRTDLQLNAKGSLEAWENTGFIDGSIMRDRQRVSQFKPADSSYGGSANSTEITRTSLSPYVRWRFGDSAKGEFRLGYNNVHTGTAGFANTQTDTASLNLVNGSAFGRLGWAFGATHTNVDRDQYAAVSSDSYRGTLTYAVDPELTARVFGGQQFNDYGGARRKFWNSGAGLKWLPTERTQIDLESSRNFYGRGFNYQASHNFGRSALSAGFAREISNSSQTTDLSQTAGIYARKLYDPTGAEISSVEFKAQLMMRAAAVDSSITDNNQRISLALEQMIKEGYTGSLDTVTNLTGLTTLSRRAYVGWTLNGVRNSVSLSYSQSDESSLNTSTTAAFGEDFSAYGRIKTRGWDASWSLKLTEQSSVGLRYNWRNTDGFGSTANTRTTSHGSTVGLTFSTQLAPKTAAALSLSESRSKGNLEYLEHSVSLTLNHTF